MGLNRQLISNKDITLQKCMKLGFLFGVLTSIALLIFFHDSNSLSYHITTNKKNHNQFLKNFTINTEGCTIPYLSPYDESVQRYIEFPKDIPQCLNTSQVILEHNKTHIWIRRELLLIKEIEDIISCCYRHFYRPVFIENINEKVDDRVKYDKCIVFKNIINVKHEFVKVNCSIGNIEVKEYFLFAPKKQFKSHNNRKMISKNKSSYNILIMGIDSVSRLNFFRTMPKVVTYLQERGVVDLNGYNKVGDNTFPNLIPILLGISDSEIKMTCLPHHYAKFDNCPFIWEWYKQAGYFTAFAEDSSWLGTFNYLRAGFSNTPTDYYPHTFFSEAESYAFKPNGFNTSSLCLNKKYFYQILLDYIEDITITLRNQRLFGLFWEVTMTHDDLNYPMAIDEHYLNLFKRMEASGYLKDTIVFILSDHGIRWGDIRYTKQGRLEERLPFVFMLFPPSFREKYSTAYNNVQLNTARLTTPYDVHATLMDLINLKYLNNEIIIERSKRLYYNSRGISLFLPIPSNRTCDLAGINDHWCTCHKSVKVYKSSKIISSATEHLIRHLNTLLVEYNKCVKLELSEVLDAVEMLAGQPEDEEIDVWREFMIVIRTLPGGGIFEATLRENNRGWAVVGSVGRLNLYGNQSHCIDDNLLKLYCYCRM